MAASDAAQLKSAREDIKDILKTTYRHSILISISRKCYVDITASKTKHRIELPKRYLNDLAGDPLHVTPTPNPHYTSSYTKAASQAAAPPARTPPMSATSSTSSMDDQPLPLARGDYRLFVFL
ncbi:hypothetical protein ZWY2020_034739 [Hordeum vulgare]|nr:hypothetical protein ZWY2020_034739 [Hordeum vulgare]